jgi:hypothetical protein
MLFSEFRHEINLLLGVKFVWDPKETVRNTSLKYEVLSTWRQTEIMKISRFPAVMQKGLTGDVMRSVREN